MSIDVDISFWLGMGQATLGRCRSIRRPTRIDEQVLWLFRSVASFPVFLCPFVRRKTFWQLHEVLVVATTGIVVVGWPSTFGRITSFHVLSKSFGRNDQWSGRSGRRRQSKLKICIRVHDQVSRSEWGRIFVHKIKYRQIGLALGFRRRSRWGKTVMISEQRSRLRCWRVLQIVVKIRPIGGVGVGC